METDADPTGDKPVAYIVFEGGGAKGFVHIGALRALEEAVSIAGAAGTSAGAMVASLVAAGYRADDLVPRQGSTTLLTRLGMGTALSLFGPGGWERVAAVRAALNSREGRQTLLRQAGWTLLGALAVGSAIGGVFGTGMARITGLPEAWAVGIGAGSGAVLALVATLMRLLSESTLGLVGGLCSTARIAALLNQAYLAAPGVQRPADGMVRFRHLPMPLTVVATRLDRREMTVFSHHATPDVAVAEAVAASICLPGIFAPALVDGVAYYDGGLVSNLPVWAFDEERRAAPEVYTIAMEISDAEDEAAHRPAARLSPLRPLVDGARAALFGGKSLHLRAIDRLCICSLPVSVGVLDFDIPLSTIRSIIDKGEVAVKSRIIHSLFTVPDLFRRFTDGVRMDLMRAFSVLDPVPGRQKPVRVRVALACPEGTQRLSLRLQHCSGYDLDEDTDEDLSLPVRGSLAGQALERGKVRFSSVPFPPSCDLHGPQNRLVRRRIWRGMRWCLAIPISDSDGRPVFVLTVDGDGDADYARRLTRNGPFWGERVEAVRAINARANQGSPPPGHGPAGIRA